MLEIYERVKKTMVGREIETKSILVAMAASKHILLEGPPGTSKSTLLRRIARESRIPLYLVEGNIDLTPAKLAGHFNPAKVMADSYNPEYFEKGPLTKAMEEGGILYIEEFNRMPADVSNVLISPMEEGEMVIPRFGTVKAVRPFTVVAAQNPYDDVGTVRVSRAFMDRICLIKMGYQSEEEEREIVRLRTGVREEGIVSLAVRVVRDTRTHPEIKLGASIRAAIDMVDLFAGMQKLANQPDQNLSIAARMALSNKIWLSEMTRRASEDLIDEILHKVRNEREFFLGEAAPRHEEAGESASAEGAQKKSDDVRAIHPTDEATGLPLLDFDTNDPMHYWRMAYYYNGHPEELESFFENPGSLNAFARMLPRLEDEASKKAMKIASRLIIKIAKQIADAGFRSGKLSLTQGADGGGDVEIDCSLERYSEAPERGILENLVCYAREKEKRAFVMMIDYSYSMKTKIILAAITAAAISLHYKNDCAILGFSSGSSLLKGMEEEIGPERVLEKLFALPSYGETNIRSALEAGLNCVGGFERKGGLLLTDGDWNRGGDPFPAANRFDKLSVIGFPPADAEKIRELALNGKGTFSFVREEEEIPKAILRCLN